MPRNWMYDDSQNWKYWEFSEAPRLQERSEMSANLPAMTLLLRRACVVSMLLPRLNGSATAEISPWDRVLGAAVEHSPAARAFIEEVSRTSPTPEVRELAKVVAEEWDLKIGAAELQRPRLVFRPELDRSNLDPRYEGWPPRVLVVAHIDSRGSVRKIKHLGNHRDGPWEERLVTQLLHSRFRPAHQGNLYVESELTLQLAVHLDSASDLFESGAGPRQSASLAAGLESATPAW